MPDFPPLGEEIFEEPPTDGEMVKGATSNWSYDHWHDPDAHHARLHALNSALDHSGEITDAQHGARTEANAHSHDNLSGVTASQHHARYTDAEAVVAAKTVKLDDFTAPDDNTDLNSSTSAHGLLKKLSNIATEFMNGQGSWSTPAGGAKINSGTYTGNSAANRAVAHGLGATPKIVFISHCVNDNSGTEWWIILVGLDRVQYQLGGTNSGLSVTQADSTNFYVGNATNYTNSANYNNQTYYWVAIG